MPAPKSLWIRKANAAVWRAKLTTPFRTALGQHDLIENVLLSIELSSGIRGYGEAAVATHITGETVQGTLKKLNAAAAGMIGREIADHLEIAYEQAEGLQKNHAALAAIEMALLDALTRSWKIPLWKFFGHQKTRLQTDMTVVIGTIPEAAQAARQIVKRGIRALKVKVGRNWDQDLERVIAVKDAAPKAELYLDANQGFSATETLKFLKVLERRGIHPVLVEQPVPKEDWEGLREVTRQSKSLVIADESVRTLQDAVRLARTKAAGGINIKLMKSGIFTAIEIALIARAYGLKLMIGEMMETPLAVTAAVHFASALGCFDYVDLDSPFFIQKSVTKGSYLRENGVYDLTRASSGIGVIPGFV